MGKMIRIKRGLDSERINYVAPLGELIWATDTQELWVGDGQTSGGIKVTTKVEQNFIPNNEKGLPGGVATLGANGKIPDNQIPAIAITNTYVVNSEQEQLALPSQEGDIAIRVDLNENYIKNSGTTGTMQDWTKLVIPPDSVTSVNGQTGVIVLNLGDINDVDLSNLTNGDLMQWDGTTWRNVSADTVGRTTFTALNDTPSNYTDSHGYIVKVDETNDELVFTDTIDGGTYTGTTAGLVPTRDSSITAPRKVNRADVNKPKKNMRRMPRRI